MADLDKSSVTLFKNLAQSVNRHLDAPDAIDALLAQVTEAAGLRSAWIFLRNEFAPGGRDHDGFVMLPERERFTLLGSSVQGEEFRAGACECQDLCRNGQFHQAHDALPCSRLSKLPETSIASRTHAAVPLRSRERLFGVLNALSGKGAALDAHALELLRAVAELASSALERAHLARIVGEWRIHEQTALLELSGRLLSRARLEDIASALVKEVVRLLQVDACALLLPDRRPDTMEFVGATGWRSDPVIEKRRVASGALSSSGQVMLSQQPVVSESRSDRRLMPALTQEWLDAEEFEAMAMVPLILEGRSIGALVIVTRSPRRFSEDVVRFLQLMANQAAIAVEKARLQQEEDERRRLEEELAIGWRIQRSLLPKRCPDVPGWQFSHFYRPARKLGGDFYDLVSLPTGPDQIGMLIGDVADKGIPAALFMAVCHTQIRRTAMMEQAPARVLELANKFILAEGEPELFASAFYAVLQPSTGALAYANAGHNPPLWFRSKSVEYEPLTADGVVLCVLDEITLEERTVHVGSGDTLLFYTDGIVEARNPDGFEYGLERLRHTVATHAQESAAEILQAIVDDLDAHMTDAEAQDDLTLVVVKRL